MQEDICCQSCVPHLHSDYIEPNKMNLRALTVVFVVLFTGSYAEKRAAIPTEACSVEPDPGVCRGMFKKWFFNMTSFRCEIFHYGGCYGNDNRFDTAVECIKQCRDPVLGICALPELSQRCRAGFPAYRFNPKKQRCERYLSCEHNKNHFETMEQCQERCGEFEQDPCSLRKDAGRKCTRQQPMKNYWFNSDSQSCELFDYNGCGGNGNNFIEESECWRTCEPFVKNPCNYPIGNGYACPNGSSQEVFGFNKETKRCERYTYAGCGGYPNRFGSASECWTTCGANSGSKCMEPGPKNGFGIVKKYYYDLKSDTCKPSRYSPFSNKKNRFDTVEYCEDTCKGGNKS